MTLKSLTNRKKPNYSSPRYSKRFNRISKPNSLRSKVFEFMRDYPLASLTQTTNYFQEEYRRQIINIDDFRNTIHVYRCQYWEQHGKVYTPNKKDLEKIRRSYNIRLFPNEFEPIEEVVIKKREDTRREFVRNTNETAQAIRNRNF